MAGSPVVTGREDVDERRENEAMRVTLDPSVKDNVRTVVVLQRDPLEAEAIVAPEAPLTGRPGDFGGRCLAGRFHAAMGPGSSYLARLGLNGKFPDFAGAFTLPNSSPAACPSLGHSKGVFSSLGSGTRNNRPGEMLEADGRSGHKNRQAMAREDAKVGSCQVQARSGQVRLGW